MVHSSSKRIFMFVTFVFYVPEVRAFLINPRGGLKPPAAKKNASGWGKAADWHPGNLPWWEGFMGFFLAAGGLNLLPLPGVTSWSYKSAGISKIYQSHLHRAFWLEGLFSVAWFGVTSFKAKPLAPFITNPNYKKLPFISNPIFKKALSHKERRRRRGVNHWGRRKNKISAVGLAFWSEKGLIGRWGVRKVENKQTILCNGFWWRRQSTRLCHNWAGGPESRL